MGLLDVFSLFVLLVITAVGVAILLTLRWLPGNIARKRHMLFDSWIFAAREARRP